MGWDFSPSNRFFRMSLSPFPLSAYPFTVVCRATYGALSGTPIGLIGLHRQSFPASWGQVSMTASVPVATPQFDFYIQASGTSSATATVSGIPSSSSAWRSFAGVATASQLWCFFDLTKSSVVSHSVAFPPNMDRARAGSAQTGTQASYHNDKLAEFAIWNAALNDDEIKAIGFGFSPLLVRPGNLVFYTPLLGQSTERDVIGGGTYSLVGFGADPTVADHPWRVGPARHRSFVPPPPTIVPAANMLNAYVA